MKALYSMWLSPQDYSNNAGYSSREDLAIGISASILMSSKFYDIYFVGCKKSVELVKSLDLPIKEYITGSFVEAPKGLWNYSKLLAMTLIEPPFIHIDNDVFLFKKLPKFKDYLFQSIESFKIYRFYDELIKNIDNSSIIIEDSIFDVNLKNAVNCGVIGVGSKDLIYEWVIPSLNLIHSDEFKELCASDDKLYEIVVEQFTAYCSAIKNCRDIKYVIDDKNILKDSVDKGYSHFISSSKRNPEKMEKIKKLLQKLKQN